jgi:hypothetical protein
MAVEPLTWYDSRDGNTEVYLFTGELGMTGDIDARARRVTMTRGESVGAYLTWNRDRIGLTWSDNTDGQYEVYFEPFDVAGTPLSAPRRLTSNSSSSLIPAIEPWADGFALAWNEFRPAAEGHHGGRSEVAFAVVR